MNNAPTLKVTDIQQQKVNEPNGQGDFHDVWHVHFTTPSGTRTHIKMPAVSYNAPNVAAAIHHEATQVEAVHALDNTPISPPLPEAPATA